MPKVVVLGSANLDYTVRVADLPRPGETVLGSSLTIAAGGKGANQAVAARGVFVGAVGPDGSPVIDALVRRGVDVSHVLRVAEPTGSAFITVDARGENSIVVAAGANGALDAAATAALIGTLLEPGDVLLAQLEIPVDVVHAAAVSAAAAGARVVLNLSPAQSVPDELLRLADPVVVNEAENDSVTVEPRSRVVTLGARGALVDGVLLPAILTDVVDTTGAGDAFAGALAAALAAGADLQTAAHAAIAAGSAAVRHPGAQPPLD